MPLPRLDLLLPNINEYSLIKKTSLAGLVAAGLAGCTLLAQDGPEPVAPAMTYVATAEVRSDISAENGVTGIVQSTTPFTIGALNGGRVVQLRAQIGDSVAAGQVLAVIDGRAAGLRVAQAEADAGRAAALAGERSAAARRAEALVATGAMSQAERDSARAEAAAAASSLASARAAAAIARTDAGDNVIRAPGSGIITERLVELGAVVTPGQQVFGIEARTGGNILAAVPAKIAPSIRPGMRVAYDTEGVAGMARVVGASPRIESGGVAPVRLAIESGAPSPGSIVRLRFSADDARSSLVRVPVAAIQTGTGGTRIIYRISKEGRAVPVQVILHGLSGGDARIAAPLAPGTPIVAAGGTFLRPGLPVRIARPGA